MFKNRTPQHPENASNPEPEILGIIRGLEPRMLLAGTAQVEDAQDKGRFIPATGADYDVVGGVIEVDEIDPTKPMQAGRYPNIRYTALVYSSESTDKFNGVKASFSRSLGRVEGDKQRTVDFDVLTDGSIVKSCTDFDGRTYSPVPNVEFSEREELAFINQLETIVAVEDLPIH